MINLNVSSLVRNSGLSLQEYLASLSIEQLRSIALQSILKSPQDRNNNENRVLQFYTKNFQFFKNLVYIEGFDMHFKFCQLLEYQQSYENQLIFKLGDCDRQYIIMDGLVELRSGDQKIEVLGIGCQFGDEQKLNGVAKCIQDTTLAVIHQKHQKQILHGIKVNEIAQETLFLQGIKLFSKLSLQALRNLFKNFTIRNYHKGQVVYEQNQVAHSLYIIKRGIIVLNTSMEMDMRQKNHVLNLSSRVVHKFMVAELSMMEIFGEIECFQNEVRQFQAVSMENQTTLYAIAYDDFWRITTDMQKNFEYYVKEKILWRKRRLDQIQKATNLMLGRRVNRPLKTIAQEEVTKKLTSSHVQRVKSQSSSAQPFKNDRQMVDQMIENKQRIQSLFGKVVLVDKGVMPSHLTSMLQRKVLECKNRIKYSQKQQRSNRSNRSQIQTRTRIKTQQSPRMKTQQSPISKATIESQSVFIHKIKKKEYPDLQTTQQFDQQDTCIFQNSRIEQSKNNLDSINRSLKPIYNKITSLNKYFCETSPFHKPNRNNRIILYQTNQELPPDQRQLNNL